MTVHTTHATLVATHMTKQHKDLLKFADDLCALFGATGTAYLNFYSDGKTIEITPFSGQYARSKTYDDVSEREWSEKRGYNDVFRYRGTLTIEPQNKCRIEYFGRHW